MNKLNKFWQKIVADGNEPDENGCWNWKGSHTGKCAVNPHAGGYGNFYIAGHTVYAHNLSYLLLVVLAGQDLSQYSDADIFAMLDKMKKGSKEGSHTCQKNRDCVNPLHVKRETHSQNMKRCLGHHGNAKLTYADVIDIRSLAAKGKAGKKDSGNVKKLAKAYKVDRTTIYHVIKRETWKDIK